jgi:hypothetical protein
MDKKGATIYKPPLNTQRSQMNKLAIILSIKDKRDFLYVKDKTDD